MQNCIDMIRVDILRTSPVSIPSHSTSIEQYRGYARSKCYVDGKDCIKVMANPPRWPVFHDGGFDKQVMVENVNDLYMVVLYRE